MTIVLQIYNATKETWSILDHLKDDQWPRDDAIQIADRRRREWQDNYYHGTRVIRVWDTRTKSIPRTLRKLAKKDLINYAY